MKDNLENSYNSSFDDSIDFIPVIKKLLAAKELIFKCVVLFFFIGVFVALLSPVLYTSETSFVPQVSSDEMSFNNDKLGSLASLSGINLKQIDVIGQQFDPHLHEALTYVASDEFEEGICTEQVRKGYQFGDKLLRAAQVVVSSGKDTKENS